MCGSIMAWEVPCHHPQPHARSRRSQRCGLLRTRLSGHGVPTATMAGKLIATAIDADCDDFDLVSGLKTLLLGGPLLRRPSLVAGMLFYSLRDLGR